MLLSKETITNISDSMKRLFPIIMVLLVVALSGCTGQDVSSQTEAQTFDRANPNLNGKIMDLELSPKDARAGEKITANLVVGNTGTENIGSETIEIKAKARSLDDILANIALLAMSEEKKTMTFTMEYNEEIKPGMIRPFTNVFPTLRELRGRNVAGIYDIMIILSVNGQKVEAKSIKLKLGSGKPRNGENTTSQNTTDAAAVTATPTPAATETPTYTVINTPTPTPTPEAVTVAPSGIIHPTNIVGGKTFAENSKTIDAGDTLQWKHMDNDDVLTVAEMDGKIPNQTVKYRTNYVFNTTGTYRFQLFYPKMKNEPSLQILTVRLNQSR